MLTGLMMQVTGQNADMLDLQRLMMRGKTKLNNSQQQNLTVRLLLPIPLQRPVFGQDTECFAGDLEYSGIFSKVV